DCVQAGVLKLDLLMPSLCSRLPPPPQGFRHSRLYRPSPSRPAEAATAGCTGTRAPVIIQARWLGEKGGANNPSLISRVTAKRLNTVGGRNKRSLLSKPSDAVSISPSTAEIIPSPFVSTSATSAA